MDQHNKKKKNSEKRSLGEIVIITLFLFATVGQAVLWFAISIVRTEEYNRVYDNAISVTATVTKHDSYWSPGNDDEAGETRYRSYIFYTVNGERYTEEYENKDEEKNLTPVGQQVAIEVSPENPQRQMSELRGYRIAMPLLLIPLTAVIALCWRYLLQRKLNLTITPDPETLERDLRLTIWGRFTLVFWLLLAVGWGIMYWRYQAIMGAVLLVGTIACGALWIWCSLRVRRDLHSVTNQAYTQKCETIRWTTKSSDGSVKAEALVQKQKTYRKIYLPGRTKEVICYVSSDKVF